MGETRMSRRIADFTKSAILLPRRPVLNAWDREVALADWDRVEMNTENQAPAMRHVAFLD
jgi:hypothetical protein